MASRSLLLRALIHPPTMPPDSSTRSTSQSRTSSSVTGRRLTGFESTTHRAIDIRIERAKALRGLCVGTMPVEHFLCKYLHSALPPTEQAIPEIDLRSLTAAKNEREMYRLLVSQHPCLSDTCSYDPTKLDSFTGVAWPKNVEFVVSADRNTNRRHLKPDIGLRLLPPSMESRQWIDRGRYIEEPYDPIHTALCVEVKHDNQDDPFIDYNPEAPTKTVSCENNTDSGRLSRGQLAMYAEQQFKHQHRVFLLQIVIVGRYARFIYWDRSGLVVSQCFDLIQRPELLMEFLWRFVHAGDRGRGWDNSATPADADELSRFTSALDKFASEESKAIPHAVAQTLAAKSRESSYPICKIQVNDEYNDRDVQNTQEKKDSFREYVIGSPFSTTSSTPGRGTRSYLADDLRNDDIKFLKDTWAVSDQTILPELGIYRLLSEHEVPAVLFPVCAGTVTDNGHPQCTTSNTWATVTEPWLAPHNTNMRQYVHGRLVQDVACSLDRLNSSRDIVFVMRNIVECE